jgi:hypothetical protein
MEQFTTLLAAINVADMTLEAAESGVEGLDVAEHLDVFQSLVTELHVMYPNLAYLLLSAPLADCSWN